MFETYFHYFFELFFLDIWDIVNHDMKWLKKENEALYKNSTIPEFLESSKKVPNKQCLLVQVRQSYEETGLTFKYLKISDGFHFSFCSKSRNLKKI